MRTRCVVGLLAYAHVALAQPAPVPAQTQAQAGSSPDAAAAFEDGRKLLAQHRPAEACARFARALEFEPGNVGVLLNLGLCNEQLDKLATALTWFRRAQLRASERSLAESQRAAADKIAALWRTVPTLQISLSPPGHGAAENGAPTATAQAQTEVQGEARIEVRIDVRIDGAVVAVSDLPRVELDAGHHVVELTAAGTRGTRTEVDVVDGAATPLALVVPAPRAEPPVVRPVVVPARPPAHGPEAEAAPASGDPAARRRRAYIAGGIGGGLVLGSVALGLVARSAAHGSEHPDIQRDWKNAARYGGTSMFVLGGAALGWAAWTLFRAPGSPERGERAAGTAGPVVAPAIGAGSVGVGVHGAF